ncbi:MAG: hypothetical protein ABIQ31_05215 [Ferruginibacter sp.]
MNSATDMWPDVFHSASGKPGHNISDHHYMLEAQGTVEGFDYLLMITSNFLKTCYVLPLNLNCRFY